MLYEVCAVDMLLFVVAALGDVNGTLSMLRTRAMDEKVNVRKASLHLLEEVIRINSAVGQNEVSIYPLNLKKLSVQFNFNRLTIM